MKLDGKNALITGAGSGMGRATALLFAREGAKVAAIDIDEKAAAETATQIERNGGKAVAIRADVSVEADAKQMVETAALQLGTPGVLFNNAGIEGESAFIGKMTAEAFDRVIAINLRGVFLGMKYVIPEMQKGKRGAIVNISSISGFTGQRMVHMAYNASKAAVRVMTKSAAVQFARDGIRVNSVHPGVMPPMRTSKLTADPVIRAKLLGAVPMGREGRVEEVAYASLFLASDEASYITGTELVVDGGYLAM